MAAIYIRTVQAEVTLYQSKPTTIHFPVEFHNCFKLMNTEIEKRLPLHQKRAANMLTAISSNKHSSFRLKPRDVSFKLLRRMKKNNLGCVVLLKRN